MRNACPVPVELRDLVGGLGDAADSNANGGAAFRSSMQRLPAGPGTARHGRAATLTILQDIYASHITDTPDRLPPQTATYPGSCSNCNPAPTAVRTVGTAPTAASSGLP